MRAAIGLLLAGLLFGSPARAADEPLPSGSPATPAPAATAEPPAPPPKIESAVPSAVATPTPSAPAAAAPTESAASTEDKKTSETTTARGAKEEADAMDAVMKRLGYKVTMMDGDKRYCKSGSVLGSRLNQRTLCWTPDQIRSHQSNIDYLRELEGQRKTWGDRMPGI